ncbi:putative reverse transcriptase zinc-binding domain-containing protein [Helianthus annuus]|nr:putative reverse transcriptase zinc-binding domain-containing protein [Helianthus annuus]
MGANGPFMQWDCHREPSTEHEVIDLMNCLNLLFGFVLGSRPGVWNWKADPTKCFTVKSARKLLCAQPETTTRFGFVWNKWVPIKVNGFGWCSFLNRLPSKDALIYRNIIIDSPLCPFCEEVSESLDHLFSAYRFSCDVWTGIASWLKIPPIFAFGYKDIMSIHLSLTKSFLTSLSPRSAALLEKLKS